MGDFFFCLLKCFRFNFKPKRIFHEQKQANFNVFAQKFPFFDLNINQKTIQTVDDKQLYVNGDEAIFDRKPITILWIVFFFAFLSPLSPSVNIFMATEWTLQSASGDGWSEFGAIVFWKSLCFIRKVGVEKICTRSFLFFRIIWRTRKFIGT